VVPCRSRSPRGLAEAAVAARAALSTEDRGRAPGTALPSGAPGLIEIEVRDGIRLGGIEGGRLVEVEEGIGAGRRIASGRGARGGERWRGVGGSRRWRSLTTTVKESVRKARMRIPALTSNKHVRDWPEIFAGDEVLATAILDRLLHHVHVVNIVGRSYRLRELQGLLQGGASSATPRSLPPESEILPQVSA